MASAAQDEELPHVDHRALERILAQTTSIETVATVFEVYADRPAAGMWDNNRNAFAAITYGELWSKIMTLSSGERSTT